jgi:methylated-DNA-[protein]-cysteine S-methyltransferase
MNDFVATPLGTIEIELHDGAVRALRFTDAPGSAPRTEAGERVRAYFSGDLRALDGARLDLQGTKFQREVWALLQKIPPGETRSYGELARLLGKPAASRAVGAANARNPIALFVPCHRVIGQQGALTGYAWGTERKRWLLDHESARTPARPSQ